MTLARTPYARLSPADIGQVDRELKKLEQMSAGLYVPKVLVHARSPYTVQGTDTMLLCDCTDGAITLTFPLAARVDGMTVQVVKSDTSANAVTLSGTFSGVVNPTLTVAHAGFTVFAMNGAYHITAAGPYPLVAGETGVTTTVYPYGAPERYGAVGNGIADDYAAITNAIASSQAQTHPWPIQLSAKRYAVSIPLRITSSDVVLVGAEGRTQAQLLPLFKYGPILVVAPSVASGYAAVPTTAALLTGTGSAMTFDGTNNYFVSLRHDCQTVEVNGIGAVTAEATFKNTAASFSSDSCFVSSSGRRLASDSVSTAFEIGVLSGGQAYALFTISGTLHQLLSVAGAVTVGTVHHLALSWDGTTVRFFLDGVQVTSQALGGTLTQKFGEDVTVGRSTTEWPEATIARGCQNGMVLDGVRISNSARYTAPFTPPTAKPASDNNTLALLNFDNQTDIFTIAHTKNGDCWTPLRRTNLVSVTNLNGVQVKNLQLNTGAAASGLYVFYAQTGAYDNLSIVGSGQTGFFLGYNSYENHVAKLNVNIGGASATGQIAVMMNVASGVTHFDHPILIGSNYQLVCVDSGVLMTMPFFAQSSTTFYNALFKGTGGNENVVLIAPSFDSEVSSAVFVSNLQVSKIPSFTVIGGELETFNTAVAEIDDASAGGSYVWKGVRFFFGSAAPANVFNIISAPAMPMQVDGCTQGGSGTPIPWANVPSAVSIARRGYKPVTFSATPIFDAGTTNTFDMTLTGNVTSSTLVHGNNGDELTFVIRQDGTGARTFAWPANVNGAGAVLAAASKVSVQAFVFDGTNARAKGPLVDAT